MHRRAIRVDVRACPLASMSDPDWFRRQVVLSLPVLLSFIVFETTAVWIRGVPARRRLAPSSQPQRVCLDTLECGRIAA